MATPGADEANKSVLQLFDPLTSPLKSPRHKTPCSDRQRDPTSPVAAFFSSMDRSKSLLTTIKKNRETNLIDLGTLQSPMLVLREDVEHLGEPQSTANTLFTPNPSSKFPIEGRIVTGRRGSNPLPPLVLDPFSPPPITSNSGYMTSIHTAGMTSNLIMTGDRRQKERLIPMDTPGRADLLVSTNFTPVPKHLPYLPGMSLRSLAASSTSSTATKRRRSSIDLGKELQQVPATADSSFDILRGEMSISASAEMSFASINSEEVARLGGAATPIGVEESPWTMRTAPSNYSLGDELLPIQEVKEILAHEIPLPDSPPSSPDSSTGFNEDACLNAPKIFPNLRRFSMAKASVSPLQFPVDEDASPPKELVSQHGLPYGGPRRTTVHVRTISMTSATSVGSAQSTATIKRASSPKKTPESNSKVVPAKQASPTRRGTIGTKAPSSATSSPSKPSPTARRVPRPSVAIKSIGSRISVGPRPSIATGSGSAQRSVGISTTALKAPPRPRGSMAPPPVPTTSGVGARPRPSVAISAGRPSISRPVSTQNPVLTKRSSRPSIASTIGGDAAAEKDNVLTTGTRANTTTARLPRQSTLPSLGETKKLGSNQASDSNESATARVMARPRITGVPKPRPSSMILPSASANPVKSIIPAKEIAPTKPVKSIPRPRTSSAGAALISRPPLVGDVTSVPLAPMRPVSVAAHRIARPKSSMSRV